MPKSTRFFLGGKAGGQKMRGVEKNNSCFFGLYGKAGKRKELEVLISNESGIWEKVTAVNSNCTACAVHDCCEMSGCFSHPKINEKTIIALNVDDLM